MQKPTSHHTNSIHINTHVHTSHSVSQAAPLMDKRVEIHGTTRADMNGQRGVATDFHYYREDESKWRYTVQLDSGEGFKLKPANVRAEESAMKGKEKKKGKKGSLGGKR